MHVSSKQQSSHCPICSRQSCFIHSQYERKLKDLPCADFSFIIFLKVSKFFCKNHDCHRRIFTERIPQVVKPWARRTVRFSLHLCTFSAVLGGAAASRLSDELHYEVSRNTMLRALSKLTIPDYETPKILGVDDFAFRKGHFYGTILVDLEKHQPIALLPDREAKTLAKWLTEHPGIEIVSRDRSQAYKSAITEAAPNAVQVADRFHLVKNLAHALERFFYSNARVLKRIDHEWHQSQYSEPIQEPRRNKEAEALAERKRANFERRRKNYEQTHTLRKKGFRVTDIAHHLGIGRRTAYQYLATPIYQKRQPYARSVPTQIDPYKSYLHDQWMAGRQNSRQLFEEIQEQGFRGGYGTVARFTRKLKQIKPKSPLRPRYRPPRLELYQLDGRGPKPKSANRGMDKPLTPRRATWLVIRPKRTLVSNEQDILERLVEHPDLCDAIALTQSFLVMLRNRFHQHLDQWLNTATNSSLKPFKQFAKGLREDYEAVKAGLTLEVSNGQVEGQNNRLKMLKRQMFGRAGLGLLSKRLIMNN